MDTYTQQQYAPLTMRTAPGQGRAIVNYLTPPQAPSAYPVAPLDRREQQLEAMQRRLMGSRTGDINAQERAITGRDSMGRSIPDRIDNGVKTNGIYNPGKVTQNG